MEEWSIVYSFRFWSLTHSLGTITWTTTLIKEKGNHVFVTISDDRYCCYRERFEAYTLGVYAKTRSLLFHADLVLTNVSYGTVILFVSTFYELLCIGDPNRHSFRTDCLDVVFHQLTSRNVITRTVLELDKVVLSTSCLVITLSFSLVIVWSYGKDTRPIKTSDLTDYRHFNFFNVTVLIGTFFLFSLYHDNRIFVNFITHYVYLF